MVELRAAVAKGLQAGTEPLKQYLTLYAKHEEFLRVDVAAYLAEVEAEVIDMEESRINVKRIIQLIEEHEAKQAAIKEEIPLSVNLALFKVNCSKVRQCEGMRGNAR